MQEFINNIGSMCAGIIGKVLLAILVYIVGRIVINWVIKLMKKSEGLSKIDKNVLQITNSAVKVALYALLVASIIGILGVPLSSITAVIAACAATVGLALQGALSNVAGGIEILLFHPYTEGDYVEIAGTEGVVKKVNILFTVLVTVDNKRVTVPNGSAMGGNVVNYSAEGTRRVELTFKAPADTDSALVLETMRATAAANELVISEPEAPYSKIAGAGDGLVEYIIRAWCKSENYWDVYFGLINDISAALGQAGVQPGIKRVVVKNDK